MKKDRKSSKNIKHSIIYSINSQCDGHCKFCSEYKNIASRRPPLTFQEIKENYFFLKNKFELDYVSLSGGEPTLHPQLFEIMDFFKKEDIGLRLITGLARFTEKKFFGKLKPYFLNFITQKQKNLSLIDASIHDLAGASKAANIRIRGLIQALKARLPLLIVTVIYKDNFKKLPELIISLKNLFQKYAPDKIFFLELRLPYIEDTPEFLIKRSLPKNIKRLKESVEKAISLLDTPTTKLTLWGFPRCYLRNFNQIDEGPIKMRLNRRLLLVNKDRQLDKAEIWDYYKNCEKLLKPYRACQKCSFRESCSGIHKDYIKRYNFPSPAPI